MDRNSPENGSICRALFEKSPEGLAFCDPSLHILMVNDEFCRMFDCERDDVVGRDLDDVVTKKTPMTLEAKKLSEEYLRSGIIQTEAIRHKADGTPFPVSIVATPVVIDGADAGSLTIYRDISERRRREEEIRNREAKFSDILNSHPELILRFTPDLVTTYANKAYCNYHGITYGEAVGRSFADHIAPEYIPLVLSKFRSLTTEKPADTSEEKVVMASGEIRWQEWTDQGIFTENGMLIEIQSVGRDITERKRMEEELAFEKEALDLLFENANEGIVLCKNDGTIVRVNPMFCRMFDYTSGEVLGQNIDELVAAEPAMIKEARDLTILTANGQSVASESSRQRKDGSLIEVSFLGVPIRTKRGTGFAFGIYRDISERKDAEEALRKSEAKFRDLFNTMPNGFYTSTPEGYFIDANPSFIKMLGYDSLDELRSVFIPTDIYVNEEERVQITTGKDLNTEFIEQLETYRLKRKDGRIIWVEDNARYIRKSDGTILNQGICRDISDRKKAEEELHRLNKELFISATTDKVTGLFNRQHFEEIMKREIAKSSRYETCISLIMIDLDNFKKLNDSRGHLAGDIALETIAGVIKENIRASDLAARWGGDEFALASPTSLEHTEIMAEKIRNLLQKLGHEGFGPVTGSFGISSFREGDSIDSLTSRADDAMYNAKHMGGNCICTR